jgi:hypothetical protein
MCLVSQAVRERSPKHSFFKSFLAREAFEAPNRGDARKGVHSHHTASLEILSVFVSFFLEHVIVAVLDRLLSQHVWVVCSRRKETNAFL